MNKLTKIIFAILGIGTVSAAGYELTPADTAINNVQSKYEASQTIKTDYNFEDSKLVKEAEDKNHVKVEIGEAGTAELTPTLTFSRWNGEAQFTVKPDISGVAKTNKKIDLSGDQIKYLADKKDYVFESDGEGYKFDIVLNEKPSSNVFSEFIESSGVEFYPQLALNAKEHKGLTCTETECKDKEGNVRLYRPEDIVDSIAVYTTGKSGDFTSLGGMNYSAGKVAHIKRIKAIDSKGDWTWCKQSIIDGLWAKTCPQEWLDNATYPVIIDPDFGYSTPGGTQWNGATDTVVGTVQTSPADAATATSISVYAHTRWGDSTQLKGLMFNSSLNLLTNGVGVACTAFTSATPTWKVSTFATPPTLTGSTNYVLGAVPSLLSVVWYYDDTGSSYEDPNSYTTPANMGGDYASYAIKFSIYATYTAAASEETQGVLIE